jgi:hypothetical protein
MNSPAYSLHLPWIKLQTELRELAFVLDRKGNPVAADVAAEIAARIDEVLNAETQAAANLQRALLN